MEKFLRKFAISRTNPTVQDSLIFPSIPDMTLFRLKLKDACVENTIFSKVSLYLKPFGLLITIVLTKWTVNNPIGTFLFTIPFYTFTCGLSCLILKYAEVSFSMTIASTTLLVTLLSTNLSPTSAHDEFLGYG